MSNINDLLSIKGKVGLVLSDADTGEIKTRRQVDNLVVQIGKDLIAAKFAGTSTATITHIGFGGNSPVTSASLSQTSLVSAYTPRLAASQVLNSNPATIVYSASLGAGVLTENIGEVGLFTALTGGTMVARTTFTVIPKGPNDLLTITWTIIFG